MIARQNSKESQTMRQQNNIGITTETLPATARTGVVSFAEVKQCIVLIRNQSVILDADVADLYGVETKHVNQAVRNNRDKFPVDYVFELTLDETKDLRSKILTANSLGSKKSTREISSKSRYAPKAFTEKGLYMLATILKSKRATAATFAIIETFAKVRALKRELVELHEGTDKKRQAQRLNRFGEMLTDIVMPDLDTVETESSLELNFFIGKIKHTVRRIRKAESPKVNEKS